MTNTPADLFTQLEILTPGEHTLGSLESFLAMLEEDPGAQFAKGAFDRLILRRTKDECLDLPEKTFVDVRVDLPSWQRKLRLLAADTIEDAIVKALERKSAMARTLLGDEEAGPSVAQFTKEQMCELLLTNRLPDVD